MKIQNSAALATTPLRETALSLVEAGLTAIDTEAVIRESCQVADGVLTVGGQSFVLAEYQHIYIVGFGKVSCTAARTLEQLLHGRVRAGAVVGITQATCEVVDTYVGTHPLPSHQNFTATKHIEEIAHQAKEDDLVIVIVSGGGSALLCSSLGECEQGERLYQSFLRTGGTIDELNTVRKHISRLKGGGLAAALYPATVIGLIFSDVIGGDASAVASGPTYFDPTTKEDAEAIIDRYQLGRFQLRETPKEAEYFTRVHNVELVSNARVLQAIAAAAKHAGYQPTIVSSSAYCTPEEILVHLQTHQAPGSCMIVGGELKIQIEAGCVGTGGRNDYLALRTVPALRDGQVFVAFATDGHDNSDAAGAIVDSHTRAQAAALGIDPVAHAECHNSYPFFAAVGGHLKTGLLESNVADVCFWLTAPPAGHAPAVHVRAPNTISRISAAVVPDSRGNDTVAVHVAAGDFCGTFAVPSGASTGAREVVALPAAEAVAQVTRVIAPALTGVSLTDQLALDARLRELDGTHQLTRLGGNATLGVSVAALRAAAAVAGIETHAYINNLFAMPAQAVAPRLVVNLINGGAHAPFGSSIQEHQIIPETDDVALALSVAEAVYDALGAHLRAVHTSTAIGRGDEGGYAVRTDDGFEPFQHLADTLAAMELPCPVSLGADMAASSFYDARRTCYRLNGVDYDADELGSWYARLHFSFPHLRYVEDPFAEHDVRQFARYARAHREVTVIGDDLTTTNRQSLVTASKASAISGIIIKPNQIGTVSDTLGTMREAYRRRVRCIVSHRSGETMDDFIADLAWGTRCFGLKAGAPTAPERRVKYERLRTLTNA